ncbi:MAG: acetate--CoA ligase family protein [Candidatus Rehaiarchaeum fermentans]|nr:acetate--CoA ligase family protein [Candidatus Rehaiarchaeum fermentans]MCW1297073.1 acetate--CoA ligase family protein [Candidatus Rehaiarchaeum fermentans]MCW1302443.1 acetate--CoA ligase family protein [Candidatus Rehaiarchaeum fermentans]
MLFDKLFNPKSIAVIGASRNPNKVGSAILRNIKLTYKGKIFVVNPFADQIQGIKSYKSILDIEDNIDVAVISIPAEKVLDALKECEKKKVSFAIIISAGFKEIGGIGQERENELKEFLKRSKIRVVGPNCLGIINTDPSVNMTFVDPNTTVFKGSTAFISQSGALLSAIVDDASMNNIGFSKIISIGNSTDIDEADIMDYLREDEKTKAIVLYIEGITNGEKFLKSLKETTKKKPVVILKGGRSNETSSAVMSHTGSLAGNYKAYQLAFEEAGAIVVSNVDDLFNFMRDAAKFEVKTNEVVIVTNSGGGGVITADHLYEAGLKRAEISEETVSALSKILPAESNLHNPIDMLGDASPERYKETLDIVSNLNKPTIVIFSPQEMSMPIDTAKVIYDMHLKKPELPLFPLFLGGTNVEKARRFLIEKGLPAYYYPNEVVDIIKGLYFYYSHRNPTYKRYSKERVKIVKFNVNKNAFGINAKQFFDKIGIETVNGMIIKDEKDLKEKISKLGYPCVLKISSNNVAHKNKIGGVITGIKNEEELIKAFKDLNEIIKKNKLENANIEIYEDATKGNKKYVEILLGGHRDPIFGPMIALGIGGIYANEIGEVEFVLPQLSDQKIEELKDTKIGKLILSASNPEIFDKIISYIIRLGKFMQVNPNIKDIDLNPLIVSQSSAVAADFKIFVEAN